MSGRDALVLTPAVEVPDRLLSESFITAGGPGGQNVNKVATAVQLRFNPAASGLFDEFQLVRIMKVAGSRATRDGDILIEASRFRTQERNREDARQRLAALLVEGMRPPPPPRKKTRPTKGAVERRLKAKASRAGIKQGRGRVGDE